MADFDKKLAKLKKLADKKGGSLPQDVVENEAAELENGLADSVRLTEELEKLGVGGVMLFGIPETKDAVGSDAMSDHGIVATAIRALKDVVGKDFLVIADVCFCEYTDHGHCGVLKKCGDAEDAWDVDPCRWPCAPQPSVRPSQSPSAQPTHH